ncbi:hypothetical protein [Kutzneria sp. 744]|uniref:hypothetical protein n=1 Tax=Kutzneria sp. (strain 744) TaxID=345341 RepID=UPI0007C5C41C|nr:hypothetical protein [Kutzneria sp. 744]
MDTVGKSVDLFRGGSASTRARAQARGGTLGTPVRGGGHDHEQCRPAQQAARPTTDELLEDLLHSKPAMTIDDLACDGIFETDEEVDEFIAFTYAERRRNLA